MTLYVATVSTEKFEGFILGVYDTEDMAQQTLDEFLVEHTEFKFYSITICELNTRLDQ